MFTKFVLSGNVMERYTYDRRTSGFGGARERTGKNDEKNYERTNINRRNVIRRLILCNFDTSAKFITLTFADNVLDVGIANYEFKNFIKRLRRVYPFKYVAVLEHQTERGKKNGDAGCLHFHMICDLPFIDCTELSRYWDNGFIKISETDISHVTNLGAYVIKYMTKDLTSMVGKKAYNCSTGLVRPKEYVNYVRNGVKSNLGAILSVTDKDMKELNAELERYDVKYHAETTNEFTGTVKYDEWNLDIKNNSEIDIDK